MNGVAVYLEGGGDTTAGKAQLRTGMSAFLTELRDLRGARRMGFKVIPCGGRRAAFEAFRDGLATDGSRNTLHVLLVDAEDAVSTRPADHLHQRDGWDLSGVDDDLAHLMVRTMETWIVSDLDALAAYYGQGFHGASLPKRDDLESVEKTALMGALTLATRNTTKGEYQKLRHASDLLAEIDPAKVRARCHHCERLFLTVRGKMGSA